jgi:hypothetical protein
MRFDAGIQTAAHKYNVTYQTNCGADMSRKAADAGDDKKHTASSSDPKSTEDASDAACDGKDTNSGSKKDDKKDDNKTDNSGKAECKTFLEILPSKGGMLLAVLVAEIMTEGLTPTQMNILGNFVTAVGALIAYKSSPPPTSLFSTLTFSRGSPSIGAISCCVSYTLWSLE